MPNGTDKPKKVETPSWSTISSQLDPLMPETQYNGLRDSYYWNVVAPKLTKGTDAKATYNEFVKLTPKGHYLDAAGRAKLHAQIALASVGSAMLEPLKDGHPDLKRGFDQIQSSLLGMNRMAESEGMDTRIAQAGGSFVGQGIDFAILSAALSPIAAGIATEMAGTVRGIEFATKIVRGGMSFGLYDAMSADSGNRLQAGVKGFALGAGFDLALGLRGYIKAAGSTAEVAEVIRNRYGAKAAKDYLAVGELPKGFVAPEEIVQQAANAGEKMPKDLDEKVAKSVSHNADVSRREMRPEKPFWQYTRTMKGSRVHVKDVNGREQLVDLRPGNEAAAYKEVRDIVERGGSISHYATHPDDHGALDEFIRIVGKAEEGKYRGTILRTPSGQAESVAKTSIAEGMPATALTPDTVEVATVSIKHPLLNKPPTVEIPKMPERRPSALEVDQALEKKKDLSSKNREFIRYHFDKVWDPNIEYEDKRSSMVILGTHAPELLPEHVRASMPPIDKSGKLIRQVAEARVQEAASKSLGWEVNIEHIGKSGKGKVVVTMATNLSDQMVGELEHALGPEYEVYVPKSIRGRTRAETARMTTDEQVNEMLEFHNVKPEDVDFEAVREGGEAELIRQLETKKPELYGKKTTTPKPQALLLDKIPPSEQREYRSVKDGIKSEGETHTLLQDAIDAGGQQRFLGSPAGSKSLDVQLKEASLSGRLMGSIEDVDPRDVVKVGAALSARGWKVLPLKGWEQGKFELVYFRQEDLGRVAPLIQDYDNFISRQAGRIFNSDGKTTLDVGEASHGRLGKAFGIADKDIEGFQKDRIGGVRPAPEVGFRNRVVLQQEDMERLYPGAAAFAVPSFEQFAESIGVDLPPSLKGGGPMVVLTPDADGRTDPQTLWHEDLHRGGMYARTYERFTEFVDPGHQQTALELVEGLGKAFPSYKKTGTKRGVEEAWVHAATAVRYGDKPYLEVLARYDTSVDHVIDFVHDTADNLLNHVLDHAPSGDTPQVRLFQRMLYSVRGRSSREVSEALRENIRATGSGIAHWYDHKTDMWVLKDRPNSEIRFKTVNDLWDYLLDRDKNFMAPSASLRSELGGVKGPIAPIGKEPDGSSLPMPEIPPEGNYSAVTGLSGMWRPFFPWLATLHEEVNQLFRKSGKYWPGYETFKAVDDGERLSGAYRQEMGQKIVDVLDRFKGKKMHSVLDYLTYPEAERTSKLMEQYGLTQADAQQAHKVWELIGEFKEGTKGKINGHQYLLEYHPKMRNFGWAPERAFGPITTPQVASFWDKAVRHDMRWDPQDGHLGKFMHFLLNESVESQFTGKALAAADKLVETKSADGRYIIPNRVRWPMVNYVRYMKGIPDTSQQAISKAIGGFADLANNKIEMLNAFLPDSMKVPKIEAPPRAIMNRFMLASYVMGLGARPALAVRDSFQAFTGGMVVLGPTRFTRGFTRFMTSPRAAFEFADNAGALLRKNNAGELLGDITQEIPSVGPGWMDRIARWSNALLAPSRWGHNFGRAITFNAEYWDAIEAIKGYRAGRQTIDQLMESTSLHFMDKPAAGNLLRYVADDHIPIEDAARKIALETVDLTQWPYRRGTQPAALTYGAGRIFGQYGVWPANYADFLYRIGKKFGERPKMATKMSLTWVAVNYAASHSMEALGADTSKWFWQSPAGFAGSPHWDFVHAAMVAPENTDEGRAARKTMLEYPLNFVPALSEMKSVFRAIEEGGMTEWPPSQRSLVRALGFKPLDESRGEQDWQDFVKTQMGYENARRRP